MNPSLKNKKILICQPIICGIGGSTVVTIELAEFLIKSGAKVTVYTCSYDYPAKKFFKNKRIPVLSADDQPDLHISDFDYIWVNSQIIPKSFLKDFSKKQKACFIFCHMSAVSWIPDERPWIYGLEDKICSLKLFIAEEIRNFNEGFTKREIPSKLFRNPAPDQYGSLRSQKSQTTPKKILIVSNHPPTEVLEAKAELEKAGITVNLLSEISGKPDLINPKYLRDSDVVITIAKTTQYCLVSGTPVYIYDHFGGPGFLNDENYRFSRSRNFSGRDTSKKSGHAIATDILNHYQEALLYQTKNREKFKKEYLNSNVLPEIFESAKPISIPPLSSDHIKAIALCQDLAINYFKALTRETHLKSERDSLIAHRDSLIVENEHLASENSTLSSEVKKLNRIYRDYENIINSEAWKIGQTITSPISHLKKLFKKQ